MREAYLDGRLYQICSRPILAKIIILVHCLVRLASFRKCTITAADYKGYALKGFLNGGTHRLSEEERKAKVVLQLTKLFGAEATNCGLSRESGVTNHLPFSLRASTYGT
jgi:hypothetical protein